MTQYINILRVSLFVALAGSCLLFPATLSAQNADYRSTISTQAALNGWQIIALSDKLIEADSLSGAYAGATGTYGLSYDFGPVKWFSIGLQGTWNNGKVGADQLSFNVEGKSYNGEAALNLRRINLGIRPLFHYGNAGRFDWYSGLRIGVNYLKISVETGTDVLTDKEVLNYLLGDSFLLNRSYRAARPTVQVIPVGMRAYLTERLGIGAELAVGPTYYLSFQAAYRF